MDSTPEDAPIGPHGLGTLRLGDSLAKVLGTLGRPALRRPGKNPVEELEILEFGAICVILKHGTVTNLLALDGYRGATEEGLVVGMTWTELQRRAPNLGFDNDLYGWVLPDKPWMEISIVRPLREGEWTETGEAEEYYRVLDPQHARVSMIAVWTRRSE